MTETAAYAGRRASLATMHDKLSLVAPPMRGLLGLDVFVATVDTDMFGTFSGEVERTAGPVDTAVAKARFGMSETGCTIGIASEGSIGTAGFLPAVSDLETVVIVDDEHGFVLAESCESHDIVARSWSVDDGMPTDTDLTHAGFPEHGLIVRGETNDGPVFKGIHSRTELENAVATCRRATGGPVRLETDLRAHHCPSRRPTVARAARRLAERLAVECPSCRCPGWGRVDVLRGRPCRLCRRPTSGAVAEVFGCARCTHRVTGPCNDSPADPATCGNCNP